MVATDRLVHNQFLDQGCAVLSEPNAKSFGQAILSVIRDDELSAKIVSGAKGFIQKHCSQGVRNEAYQELMRQIASHD